MTHGLSGSSCITSNYGGKTMKDEKDRKGLDPTPDSNPDPITGEKGSHPVGVAGGGTGGALAGAAIGGAVGGPIGAAVGAAAGAVAGGLAGKGIAEAVNPTVEEEYWQKEYKNRPYYKTGTDYNTYQPYYKYGYESAARPEFKGRRYEDVERQLESEWPSYRGTAKGEFREYRGATRDAYERASSSVSRAGNEAAGKSNALWEELKGNWKQMKGSIKENWNQLTDDDIEAMEGRREKIIGKIQERYGEAKYSAEDIEHELSDLYYAKK
jgi:uncharacterized protein YjbJ (UPF0337 family)